MTVVVVFLGIQFCLNGLELQVFPLPNTQLVDFTVSLGSMSETTSKCHETSNDGLSEKLTTSIAEKPHTSPHLCGYLSFRVELTFVVSLVESWKVPPKSNEIITSCNDRYKNRCHLPTFCNSAEPRKTTNSTDFHSLSISSQFRQMCAYRLIAD